MTGREEKAGREGPGTDSRPTGVGHPHIGARSLEMARIVVERIDAEPSLFNVSHENLKRWRWLHGTLGRASKEWGQLLKRPWSEIRAIVLEGSDEGPRLRSTHPFRGIVTEEERLVIIKRHPPPWPHVPYDPAKIPGEVMERILSEGPAFSGASSCQPKHRDRGP